MIKLHLGCGDSVLPGWINLDARTGPQVDVVDDARTLCSIPSQSIDLIYASHLLDHFSRVDTDAVLRVWRSKLRPGGTLRLAVSDFSAIVEEYQDGRPLSELLGLLVGGHKDSFDRHGTAFDFALLDGALHMAGFEKVARYDWRETDHADHDDFSHAYLPHMDTSGRLMSLNVEAEVPANNSGELPEWYVLGDSHSWVFTQAFARPRLFIGADTVRSLDGRFEVRYVGPWLAHGLDRREKMDRLKDEFRSIPHRSRVIFSFGEIDCRCHVVPRAKELGISIEASAVDVATRYLDVATSVASIGYDVSLWNVPPPTGGPCYNQEFPIRGTYVERRAATEALNDGLRVGVARNGLRFIDVYSELVHGSRTCTGMFLDQIHLDPRQVGPLIEEVLACAC